MINFFTKIILKFRNNYFMLIKLKEMKFSKFLSTPNFQEQNITKYYDLINIINNNDNK